MYMQYNVSPFFVACLLNRWPRASSVRCLHSRSEDQRVDHVTKLEASLSRLSRLHKLLFVCCQRTVSLRQHASACVSLRQHTSAYYIPYWTHFDFCVLGHSPSPTAPHLCGQAVAGGQAHAHRLQHREGVNPAPLQAAAEVEALFMSKFGNLSVEGGGTETDTGAEAGSGSAERDDVLKSMEAECTVLFTPCGHLCVCSTCDSLIMGTTKM